MANTLEKGTIDSGYMFMGGDPSDKNSWRSLDDIKNTIDKTKESSLPKSDNRSYSQKVSQAPKKIGGDLVDTVSNIWSNFVTPVTDYAGDVFNSFAQGATFDTMGSMGARVQSGLDALGGEITDTDEKLARQGFTGDLTSSSEDLYKKAKIEEEQRLAKSRENAGVVGDIAHFAGEAAATHLLAAPIAGVASSVPVVGDIISQGIKPTQSVLDAYRKSGLIQGAAKELGKRAIGESVVGSGIGATTGALQSEGDLATEEGRKQILEDATSGSIVGAGIGGLGGVAGGIIGIGGQKGKEWAKSGIDAAKTSEYPLVRRIAKSLEKGYNVPKSLATEEELGVVLPKPGTEDKIISGKEIHSTTSDADKLTSRIIDSEKQIINDMNESLQKAKSDGVQINLNNAAKGNEIIDSMTPIPKDVIDRYEKQSALAVGSGLPPISPIKIPDIKSFIAENFNGDIDAYKAVKKVIDNQNDPVAFKNAYDELRNIISSYAKSASTGNVAETRIYNRLVNIKDQFKNALKDSTKDYGFGLHSDRLAYLRKNVNENVLGIQGQFGKQNYYATLPNRENILRDSIENIIAGKGPDADQLRSQLLTGLKDQAEGEATLTRIGRINKPAIPGYEGNANPTKNDVTNHLYNFSEELKDMVDKAAISKKMKRTGYDAHANMLNQGLGALTHSSPSTEGRAYGVTEFLGRTAKIGVDFAKSIREMPDNQISALADKMGGPVGNLLKRSVGGNSMLREQAIFLMLQNPKYKKYLDENIEQ